jgi:serine/threonine protein kinase/tetratricopeptide (TPR) repeat protein
MRKPVNVTGPGQHWNAVLSTFDDVVALRPDVRAERLRTIGSSDPGLRRQVEALLAADAQADTRLARVDAIFGLHRSDDTRQRPAVDPLGLVGRTVSHFRIVEPLAYGGMGVVYRAEDTQLRRAIALKFPLPGPHFDRRVKERFLHEARITGALDHPNLCVTYEAGETDDGLLFYAMPLYDGETLKARLAREGVLPIADALRIAQQIARGLGAAHRAGIIHRDLKAANVMLLPDGTVKVLDFGLARASDLGLTASYTILGTVSYMAPEQVLGEKLDARTDLWALGVLLYEMMTGRKPFEGAHDITVAHSILYTEPVQPSRLRGDIPASAEIVVRTLLSKDPANRCASADEVATRLDAVQSGPLPSPRKVLPPSSPGQPSTPGQKSRRTHIRARAAVFTLVMAGTLVVSASLISRNQGPTPEPRTIAVLAFETPGGDADRQYLGAGLRGAIWNDLLQLGGVVTPSSLATSPYDRSSTPLPQIAHELGASAVLTGSVERIGDRIRVDAQLFDARTSSQRWSHRYERPVAELQDLQRSLTRAALAAARVELTRTERAQLYRPVTSSAEAYDVYLRAMDLESRLPRYLGVRVQLEHAQELQSLYSRARDIDPDFALARARLALLLMQSAARYDTMPARREQARIEAETALRLHPGLPHAHGALGVYYAWRGEDMPRAIEEFQRAIEQAPNGGELHHVLAGLYRSLGRWQDAVTTYERAMQLEPRNPRVLWAAALTYSHLRRDEDAMRMFDRALELTPDDHMVALLKGHSYLKWKGTEDTLAAVLRRVPPEWDPDGMATWARFMVLRVQRREAEALPMLDASSHQLSRDGLVYQPASLMRAQIHEVLGDRSRAQANYEAARTFLVDSADAYPHNASIRAALGLAYAGLGRKRDALEAARRAMDLVPLTQESAVATAFMGVAVEVYARTGEFDAAMALLELLLAIPAGREITVPFLRVWPGFDPLRTDPRFEPLLERFASDT